MKIKEQFATTLVLFNLQTSYRWAGRHTYPVYLHKSDYFNYVLEMERGQAWQSLHDLFQDVEREATLETLQPFVNFLKERWRRIANITELTYYRNFADELTLICDTLANELRMGHRLQLLMPTVNFENENLDLTISALDTLIEEDHLKSSYIKAGADIGKLILITAINNEVMQQLTPEQFNAAYREGIKSSMTEKVQLHHFVVDENKRMIHVLDCLSDAQLDGRLKHTNKLFTHKLSALSKEDTCRVVYHSQESKLLYEAVLEFWEKRRSSHSIGGHINRLITALSKHGISTIQPIAAPPVSFEIPESTRVLNTILASGDADSLHAINVVFDLVASVVKSAPDPNLDRATEDKPDWDLRDDVITFYQFTKILTPAELEDLYQLNSAYEEYRSFKYYWFRLLQGFQFILTDEEIVEINKYMTICKEIEIAEREAIAIPAVQLTAVATDVIAETAMVLDMAREVEQAMATDSVTTESDEEETNSDAEEAIVDLIEAGPVENAEVYHEYDAPNGERPCVEIIADYFDTMLAQNFELYYKVPERYVDLEEESLLKVKSKFEIIRDDFRSKLATGRLTPVNPQMISQHIEYPWTSLSNNCFKTKILFSSLVTDPQSLVKMMTGLPEGFYQWALPHFTKQTLKKIINTADGLNYVLNNLKRKPKYFVWNQLKKFYGNPFFKQIINTFDDLKSMLQAQPIMQRNLLTRIGKTHLRYLIDSKAGLDSLREVLTDVNYKYLTKKLLERKHVSRLITAANRAAREQEAKPEVVALATGVGGLTSASLSFFGGKKRTSPVKIDVEDHKKLKTEEKEEFKEHSAVNRTLLRA
jgi:hypothetical protein